MARRQGGPGWVRPMLVVVLPVVLATTAAVLVLTRLLDVTTSQGRLEMIRTALAVGAGTGAVMTLVLAWRRQWSTEHDASERRLTELYVKAVEQLGSDKAAVRHGALYALERVAQDNPDHRQTVVDVICAYLRGPYNPPPDKPGVRKLGGLRAPLRPNRHPRHAAIPAAATPSPTSDDHDRRQEKEVRLTAQRILRRHLHRGSLSRFRRPVRSFWPGINLDLTGATLINFQLDGCTIGDARFAGATFTGNTGFTLATFKGNAEFAKATFTGFAGFAGATFVGRAWFGGVTFTGDTSFVVAAFKGFAGFAKATFTGKAEFGHATFASGANFVEATFAGRTWFPGATFTGATFGKATFTGDTWFGAVTFTGDTSFVGATFAQGVPPEVERFMASEAS